MKVEPDPEIRFLAFRYEPYYPAGGTGDLIDDYPTLEAALHAPEVDHIYDTWTGREWDWLEIRDMRKEAGS